MPSTVGVKIGCCGFEGRREDYFPRFPAIEIDQTFYEPPGLAAAAQWRSEAPPDFEFAIRAWQVITHEAGSPTYSRLSTPLDEASQMGLGSFKPSQVVWWGWQHTRDFARALRAKAIVFQCPASFKPTDQNKANLRQFFQAAQRDCAILDLDFKFVWEPWGEWPDADISALCSELGLVHGVDPFARLPLTEGWCYFRLHGLLNYKHRYTDSELWRLVETVRKFPAGYCFFNNLSMSQDAERLIRIVEGRAEPPPKHQKPARA